MIKTSQSNQADTESHSIGTTELNSSGQVKNIKRGKKNEVGRS